MQVYTDPGKPSRLVLRDEQGRVFNLDTKLTRVRTRA